MPSVWPGGWWRVRDIVEQQKIAAWATVDLAARNRETVLRNMYLKASRQVERGRTGPVKAYVLAAGQHDPLTVRKLVNMFLASGVEVHETKSQVIVDGRVYAPGSFVVTMAQPKQALVRWMLGRTFYPDNTYTRDRDGNPIRPYDMSTDTFGEFMGVRSDPIGEAIPAASLTRIAAPLVPTASVPPSAPHGYVLDGRLNDSYRAAFLLLAKGIPVRRANQALPDGRIRAGDFLIPPGPDVAPIARQAGVDFVAVANPVPADTTALTAPRVGLFQRYRGGNMDEGWTRLLFEQFDVPFTTVRDADLKAGGLDSKFDVIVLPADSPGAMIGEEPGAGGRGGGAGGGAGEAQRRTPPEYRSGFGADGVKALQAFVEAGGTLLTFGQAADLPVQRFGLPVRNVVAGLSSKEFWAPGSTLRVRYANDQPLAFGMPSEGLALFMSGSKAYEVTSTDRSQDVTILATYVDRDILQSGWLLGEQVIARKAAAVAVTQGKGRVVLIGFRPQNRAQTQARSIWCSTRSLPERVEHHQFQKFRISPPPQRFEGWRWW